MGQTARVCSSHDIRAALLDTDDNVAPSSLSSLHWSTRSPSQLVVAAPLACSRKFPNEEQQVYIDWFTNTLCVLKGVADREQVQGMVSQDEPELHSRRK